MTDIPAHQMREGQAERLAADLMALTYDWDNSPMPDGAETLHTVSCGQARAAAALIRAQEREIMNLREALREDADDLDDAGKPVAAASIRSLAEAKPSHPGEDGV